MIPIVCRNIDACSAVLVSFLEFLFDILLYCTSQEDKAT